MNQNIFNVVLALTEEKHKLVSDCDFDSAAKTRDRVDFLRKRIDICYDACAGLKCPEILPQLIAAMQESQDLSPNIKNLLNLAVKGRE